MAGRRRDRGAAAPLVLVNPLPRALHHYEAALRAHMAGIRVESSALDIELSHRKRGRRRSARLAAAIRVARSVLDPRPRLVLWPVFGLADLAFARLSRGVRAVVVHDPVPLRRQIGFGRVATTLGRWGGRGRNAVVVTHTQLAAQALRELGVSTHMVVPHPVLRPEGKPRVTDSVPTVVVAGQCKDARNLELLHELAGLLPPTWRLRICGRGWPAIPRWDVDARFLPEAELDEALRTSHVLLLPYAYYFQSGIATRAFEVGTPVVGLRHEFLEQLFGPQWPGLVEEDDIDQWIRALEAMATSGTGVPAHSGTAIDEAWQAMARELTAVPA